VTDRTEVRPNGAPIFEPIFIEQSSACSTLSKVHNVDIATNRLEATSEWALGQALATGVGSDNPSFADADSVSVVEDIDNIGLAVVQSISCLEQAVADFGFGAEAVLHAPLRAAAYLANARMMTDDYFSPSGMKWILSPGYPVEDDVITVWATGSVFAGVGDAYTLTDGVTGRPPVGWRTNTAAAYRQRLGLAAFDPCLLLAASFTVPVCSGGS
jgi:hypothetical protein